MSQNWPRMNAGAIARLVPTMLPTITRLHISRARLAIIRPSVRPPHLSSLMLTTSNQCARELCKRVMVGNMVGTSLAMAPAFILGQFCDIVDLDGPTFLVKDRTPGVVYADGRIDCPDHVWGAPDTVL